MYLNKLLVCVPLKAAMFIKPHRFVAMISNSLGCGLPPPEKTSYLTTFRPLTLVLLNSQDAGVGGSFSNWQRVVVQNRVVRIASPWNVLPDTHLVSCALLIPEKRGGTNHRSDANSSTELNWFGSQRCHWRTLYK